MLHITNAEVHRFIFTVMHISICFIYMMIIFGNSTYFHISLCMHFLRSMPVFIIVDVLVCICACTTFHNDAYARKLLLLLFDACAHYCTCTYMCIHFLIYEQQMILPIHCLHYLFCSMIMLTVVWVFYDDHKYIHKTKSKSLAGL